MYKLYITKKGFKITWYDDEGYKYMKGTLDELHHYIYLI